MDNLDRDAGFSRPLAWMDVTTFDADAAAGFHGALFGWDRELNPLSDAPDYSFYRSRGEAVAALDPIVPEKGPPKWTIFVQISDLEKTLLKIERNGGEVVMRGEQILSHGLLALASDSTGAEFGLWIPGRFTPPGLQSGVPGLLVGAQMETPDPDRAADFYEATFGWTPAAPSGDQGIRRLDAGDRSVALIGAEGAAQWLPWLGVDDIESSVAKANDLGADVTTGAAGLPIVTWEDGAAFCLSPL